MALDIRKTEYYNITVEGHVGEGSKILSRLCRCRG